MKGLISDDILRIQSQFTVNLWPATRSEHGSYERLSGTERKGGRRRRGLYVPGTDISFDIYYLFLDHIRLNDNDYIMRESIMRPARLDDPVVKRMEYSELRKKLSEHRQKVCADTFTCDVHASINKPSGLDCKLGKNWETQELKLLLKITARKLQ